MNNIPTLLSGKKGLVVGVANDKSLAWGIAQACHAAGAQVGFTYLNEALEKRVRPLAESVNSPLIVPCDVNKDNDLTALAQHVHKTFGEVDFIVHGVAFANKEELNGGITNTTRTGFNMALETSAYSLIALVKALKPVMAKDATMTTLTYLGAERVVPNYNVMGVAKAALEASVRYLADELSPEGKRINAISAGPVRTLAASGIGGFRDMLSHHEQTAPLRRLTTQEDVAKAALYQLSDLSQGMTGEVTYIDGGVNIQASAAF